MSFLMLIVNLIEGFIFPYFLSNYFDVKNKKVFILVSGIIQYTVLNLCSYYNQSGYPLTIFIILFNYLTLFISEKKMEFTHFYIVTFFNFLLLSTSYAGIYSEMMIHQFIAYPDQYSLYCLCFIAKVLLVVLTWLILKNKQKLQFSLELMSWSLVLFYQGLLVVLSALVGTILMTNNINTTLLLSLSVLVIVCNIYFLYIISKIEKLNKDKLVYEKQLQQEQFNKEKLATMKQIKNEIDAIDHRLFYVVYEIDTLLKKNQYNKIEKLLDSYKNLMIKHKMVVNTGNSVFDCLLSLKINDLIIKGIDVKTCMFISKHEDYDNTPLISSIISILNLMYETEFLDIDLREISGFLKLSFLFNGSKVNLNAVEEMIKEMDESYQASYRLISTKNEHMELVIVLKLGV